MLQWTARKLTVIGLLTVSIGAPGCQDSATQVTDLESEFAELSNIETGITSQVGAINVSHSNDRTDASGSRLQMNRGEQFQFARTIQQSMTQQSRGSRRLSSSSLSMQITLRVEEVESDRILLTAKYSDITYSHDIAGQRVQFNESTPPAGLPLELQPYRGLADNEFSFWIGQNNRIESVVAFPEFLSRCLRYVPASQQAAMIRQMSVVSPEDAVTSFVDETIGMLPVGSTAEPLNVGDSWNQDRQINSPLPMYLSSTCSMKDLSPASATVSIIGKISAPNGSGPLRQGVQLILKDGQTVGRCQFDRATGLPIDCRVERNLDLDAKLNDGTIVRQVKKIITTIVAQGMPPVANDTARNTIQQVSGQQPQPGGTASAHYPDEGMQQLGFEQ